MRLWPRWRPMVSKGQLLAAKGSPAWPVALLQGVLPLPLCPLRASPVGRHTKPHPSVPALLYCCVWQTRGRRRGGGMLSSTTFPQRATPWVLATALWRSWAKCPTRPIPHHRRHPLLTLRATQRWLARPTPCRPRRPPLAPRRRRPLTPFSSRRRRRRWQGLARACAAACCAQTHLLCTSRSAWWRRWRPCCCGSAAGGGQAARGPARAAAALGCGTCRCLCARPRAGALPPASLLGRLGAPALNMHGSTGGIVMGSYALADARHVARRQCNGH